MNNQNKATFSEIFQDLKNGILDWIPDEIIEFRNKFWIPRSGDTCKIDLLSITRFVELINETQKGGITEENRPDCLDEFLRYIKNTKGGQVTDKGLCVITTEFFNELMITNNLNSVRLIEKFEKSNNKCVSLFFDNGKPNVVKGLFKSYWLTQDKLAFLIC